MLFIFKNSANLGTDAVLQVIQYYEANYPEMLHRAYVINGIIVFARKIYN